MSAGLCREYEERVAHLQIWQSAFAMIALCHASEVTIVCCSKPKTTKKEERGKREEDGMGRLMRIFSEQEHFNHNSSLNLYFSSQLLYLT